MRTSKPLQSLVIPSRPVPPILGPSILEVLSPLTGPILEVLIRILLLDLRSTLLLTTLVSFPCGGSKGTRADLTGPVMEYMAACKHGESTADMSATRSDDIVR
jgi:hypothetical protein